MSNKAEMVLAPKMGKINVVATTANTVFNIDLGADAIGSYVTMIHDSGTGTVAPFYVTHGPTATITNPSPTSVSGDSRTWLETGRYDRVIDSESRFVDIYPTATGYFRYYISSSRG